MPTRKHAENLQRLEELRPLFERLKAERIRAESEIERLQRELDAARQAAREELGTEDEGEIRRMMADAQARNTAVVEEFAAALRDVEARLVGLQEAS